MNSNQTLGRDRALYDKVLKTAPNGVVPMMGTLREQEVLADNQTTYKFNFNEQKAGAAKTDILLSIKDAFAVNGLSLGILVERKNSPGSGVVLFYPDAATIANAGTTSYFDLESVYNGQIKCQIEREVMLDKLSTRRFRRVPQRQVSEGSFTGAGGAVVRYATAAEQVFSDGIVAIEPNIILRGTKNNEFTVSLPAFGRTPAIAATDPAWQVSIVLEAHGFLIPGGAGLVQN